MKLSVIIPVYNSQETIVESVDSVVRECVSNPYSWELILVDDGSADNSAELVTDYIERSAVGGQIRFIRQTNGGAAVARNTGLRIAKGEFIAFNDSDDKWLEGKLALQISYLTEHTDVMMVAGIFGSDNMSSLKTINEPTVITIKDQVLKNYFSPPTTIIRSSILKESGLFNEKMRYAEEGYFFNNITYYGKAVLLNKCVTEPLTPKERWGDNGLSGNLVKMEQGELYNIYSAYRFKYISLLMYIFATCFSIAKFVRRLILSKYKKLCK